MTLDRKPFEVESLRLAPWTSPDSEAAQEVAVPGNQRLSANQKDIESYVEGAWRSLTLLRDYQYVADETESIHTGTNWFEKIALQTPTLTGTYRLEWSTGFTAHARLGHGRIRDTTNDVVHGGSSILLDPGNYIVVTRFKDLVFTNEARRFAIEMALESFNAQASVRLVNTRIAIARVS